MSASDNVGKVITISEIGQRAKLFGEQRGLWKGYDTRVDVFNKDMVTEQAEKNLCIMVKNLMHVQSEVTELYKAVNRDKDYENAREEGVDIIMATLGCLAMMGINLVDEDFKRVFDKNEQRVLDLQVAKV